MLFMLGPVRMEVAPLNAMDHSRSGETQFADHQVLGGAPVYEHMGEGSRQFTIKGVTFPASVGFQGGMAAIDLIETIRRAGQPMPLIRGDFRPLGWVLINKLQEDGESLQFNGVAGKLNFEVSLTVCDAPGIGAIGSIVSRLFG